jgi:prophage tail gpP-like protein
VIRFTIRTKVQDAWYASAAEGIAVKNVSLKDFILALYEPLGYSESDFVFRGSVARDLITGRSSTNQGSDTTDLEPIKLDAAKVRPPETIYEAADRHLRRHGLMHWDSPDGRIVVAAPNDEQDPLYTLTLSRANQGLGNNVLGTTRTRDWSGIPSKVGLYGVGSGRGTSRARVSATAEDEDVIAAGFHRPVTILAEAVKTQALAGRAAARELAARSKSKDSFDVEVDGLSFWDGYVGIPWGVDTVAEVHTDAAGGSCGAYYLHRTILQRNATDGDKTNVSLVRKGVWKL